jgi:hypothetical protein
MRRSLDQMFPKQQFFRPFRAVRLFCPYLGLKPQAESYYPFGIGLRIPDGPTRFAAAFCRFAVSPSRLFAHSPSTRRPPTP